jgi:hypothetical protein
MCTDLHLTALRVGLESNDDERPITVLPHIELGRPLSKHINEKPRSLDIPNPHRPPRHIIREQYPFFRIALQPNEARRILTFDHLRLHPEREENLIVSRHDKLSKSHIIP